MRRHNPRKWFRRIRKKLQQVTSIIEDWKTFSFINRAKLSTMEATESKEKETLKRTYGKIVLMLENATLSSEKLETKTVSQQDGLSQETEMDLRILGCELIQTAGILLKLPQVSNSRTIALQKIIRARHVWWKSTSTMMLKWLKSFSKLKFNEAPLLSLAGRHGIGTSAFPAILLLQVLRPPWYGGDRDGLHLPGVEDWGSAEAAPGCSECF